MKFLDPIDLQKTPLYGTVRRIDDLGRVVIPKELRNTLDMSEGDALEIFATTAGQIVMQKYAPVMRKES
jgi:AbrB family looped-hinge helix DNA binding protein